MDSSSLNATEIAVGSLLAGGRGGYGVGGGGAWGGGTCGVAPWAGPASNAARIEGVERTVNQQADCINGTLESLSRTLSFDALTKTVTDGNTRLCDKSEATAVRNSDQLFALSRDIDNKFALVTEQNHRAEVKSVEQYCDLKAGQATIEAKIDANQKFNELFSENQALKTQIACGCVTGCSTPCNGHGHHGRD